MNGNDSKGIVLQERDRILLRELGVMRIIDREQAKCVAGFGSTTRANARLLALTRANLLRRFFVGTEAGGKKALYALSPTGAKLVATPYRGLRRKPDEVLVADFFVSHQLQINRIYCTLKHRPIPVPGAELHSWTAFFEPVVPGSSLIPDGYAVIRTPARTIAAFLEVDLGHESRSVWQAKVREYLRFAITGGFAKRFGHEQFRVLVVTTSERRMASLRTATAALTDRIFWLSTFDLTAGDGFWSPVWLRPKGDQHQPLL